MRKVRLLLFRDKIGNVEEATLFVGSGSCSASAAVRLRIVWNRNQVREQMKRLRAALLLVRHLFEYCTESGERWMRESETEHPSISCVPVLLALGRSAQDARRKSGGKQGSATRQTRSTLCSLMHIGLLDTECCLLYYSTCANGWIWPKVIIQSRVHRPNRSRWVANELRRCASGASTCSEPSCAV